MKMNDVFPKWKRLSVDRPVRHSDVLLCYENSNIVYSAYYDGYVFIDTLNQLLSNVNRDDVYWMYAPKTIKELRENKTEWKHDNSNISLR